MKSYHDNTEAVSFFIFVFVKERAACLNVAALHRANSHISKGDLERLTN